MNVSRVIFLTMAVAALAACGPAPSDEVAPQAAEAAAAADAVVDEAPPAAPATAGPQVEVPATTMIHAEPAALPDCTPAVVTLRWDVREAKPGLPSIKIYTGTGKLFTHMGSFGSIETGSWVEPGSVFVLKSGTDDTELERLTIGGPVCSGG